MAVYPDEVFGQENAFITRAVSIIVASLRRGKVGTDLLTPREQFQTEKVLMPHKKGFRFVLLSQENRLLASFTLACLLVAGCSHQLWAAVGVAANPSTVNFGQVEIGNSSTQTITFTVPAGVTLNGISAYTQGAPNLDFTVTGGTCALGTTNATCTVRAQFLAKSPGNRFGAIVLTNAINQTLITVPLYGTGSGPQIGFAPGTISTYAGGGTSAAVSFTGPARSAKLGGVSGLALDAAGNLFMADAGADIVRKVAADGTISTIAGTGAFGYSGDGGPAINAQFGITTAIALDGANNLYATDYPNQAIRKITPDGTITTVAGGNGQGYTGDTGQAKAAQLRFPEGIAVDGAGNLYIADTGNNLVRKVGLDGVITTVAGAYNNGNAGYSGDGGAATKASMNSPYGIAVDGAGNLFIADLWNRRIRKVDSNGIITTVAGNGTYGFSGDGGPATSAQLANPNNVAVDAVGNLYISDYLNSVVRRVDASGVITTVVGIGPCPYPWNACYTGDGGPATSAAIYDPSAVVVDSGGNLYIADNNAVVRKVDVSDPPALTFADTAIGDTSAAQDVAVRNVGNAPLNISQITVDPFFSIGGADTTCLASGELLGSGGQCVLGIEFMPTGIASYSGNVVVSDDGAGGNSATQTITLKGKGIGKAQVISFTDPGAFVYGTVVTIPLSASATSSLPVSLTLLSGPATLSGTTLTITGAGLVNVQGTQAGDAKYAAATPVTLSISIYQASLNVWANNQSIVFGQPIPALDGTVDGVVSGDGITATYTTAATKSSVPAWYEIDPVLHDPNGKLSNYVVSLIPGTLVINPDVAASIQVPSPGAALGTSNVAFTWNTGSGVNGGYQLLLGTTGVGSSNLYSSGLLSSTGASVESLPANGVTVYARLFTKLYSGWSYVDSTFMEAGTATPAVLLTPSSSVIGTTDVTFTWTTGTGVTGGYQLVAGTTGVGSSNLYSSGIITSTNATIASIPANAVPVYVRLFSKTNGVWKYNDYTFTESGSPTPAVMQSPSAGTKLGTTDVSFLWSAGVGVTGGYQLFVGTGGVGSSDLYSSGVIAATSATVSSIPANALPVYVRLFSKIGGTWSHLDYIYSEAGTTTPAELLSPVAGSVLGTTDVQFTWTAGVGVNGGYQLLVGTSGPGSSNLFSTGVTPATTAQVPSIPTGGAKVYVRLFSKSNGVWQFHDYTFTEQ